MEAHENSNNKKNKMKQNQPIKKRGYYYSAANINKRQEIKKQFNQDKNSGKNNSEEDFFQNKKNLLNFSQGNSPDINLNNMKNFTNNKNDIELYKKNNLLLNYLESERKEFGTILNKLKMINFSIGNLILKPKIKNYEINQKIIREKEKTAQEEINFNKNISDKIDAALNNANIALDNIKYLGKSKNSKQQPFNIENNDININSINAINTKYNYNEFKKEKEKINLFNIAQKCLDKYEDFIQINNDNHDEYFINVSKTRKLFKDAKEQLQSSKFRLRNSGMLFEEIYNSRKYANREEPVTLIHLNKEIFFIENNFIRINSFLKSEIFKKLFVKVLYNENFIENINLQNINNNFKKNNILQNNDIYNIFSLWYMVKEIIILLKQMKENNISKSLFIDKNINETLFNSFEQINNEIDSKNNLFLKHHIFDFCERYLAFLNRKSNNSFNINENKIFTDDYHKIYEIFFKFEQSKIAKFIMDSIENSFSSQNIISKEELNYYKNIQSIFTNKGKYICSIINK